MIRNGVCYFCPNPFWHVMTLNDPDYSFALSFLDLLFEDRHPGFPQCRHLIGWCSALPSPWSLAVVA